jgi:hypothetical protein
MFTGLHGNIWTFSKEHGSHRAKQNKMKQNRRSSGVAYLLSTDLLAIYLSIYPFTLPPTSLLSCIHLFISTCHTDIF